jgi:iron complex outermembrane recepter protein
MRGKVLWRATDDLQITVAADWTHEDQPATASTLLEAFPSGAGNLAAAYNGCIAGAPALFCTLPRATVLTTVTSSNSLSYGNQFIPPNIDETYATGNNFSRLDAFGSTMIIDWSGPFGTHLKSITGYRGLNWKVAFDADGSPITINQPDFAEGQHQRSDELQLTGKALDNKLDYVAGLYYFNEHGFILDLPTFAGGLFQVDGQNLLNTDSYASYTRRCR